MIQILGCMFTYFYVMNDYGFKPGNLFWLDNEEGYFPKSTDFYNPNSSNNGNANFGVEEHRGEIYRLHSTHGAIDLRLFYTG